MVPNSMSRVAQVSAILHGVEIFVCNDVLYALFDQLIRREVFHFTDLLEHLPRLFIYPDRIIEHTGFSFLSAVARASPTVCKFYSEDQASLTQLISYSNLMTKSITLRVLLGRGSPLREQRQPRRLRTPLHRSRTYLGIRQGSILLRLCRLW
jgi:hypothetical protein